MLESALQAAQRLAVARVRVTELRHEEVPEYPMAALREALVNAVAHRDYRRYAVGTQVHVRFFLNRAEAQNPGGPFGPVTIDVLGELGIQATRNAALARMLEDLGPMENRGTGLAAMAAAMRSAHLPPPEFHDGRTFFRVTLRNETLVSGKVLEWLQRFAGFELSDRQRLALACVRRFGRITSREYRLLEPLGSRQAPRELKDLVEKGLLKPVGTRGGTHYVLAEGAAGVWEVPRHLAQRERQILAALASHGELRTGELVAATGLPRHVVLGSRARLMTRGLVEPSEAAAHATTRRYRIVRARGTRGPRRCRQARVWWLFARLARGGFGEAAGEERLPAGGGLVPAGILSGTRR